MQFNSVLCGICNREKLLCACQTVLIDVGHHNHRRADVTMQRIGQRAKPHRTCACKNGKLPVLTDTHFVFIYAHARVEAGVECADAAAHWLGKGCLIICLSFVFKQAAKFHHLGGQDAISCVAAEKLVGIAGRPHGSLVIERGL